MKLRYSLEAPGFLLLFAIRQVLLMESKAPTWWASSPRGVSGSLRQSQPGGSGDWALLGKPYKKPSATLQSPLLQPATCWPGCTGCRV